MYLTGGKESKINWREALICLLEMSPLYCDAYSATQEAVTKEEEGGGGGWRIRGMQRKGERGKGKRSKALNEKCKREMGDL